MLLSRCRSKSHKDIPIRLHSSLYSIRNKEKNICYWSRGDQTAARNAYSAGTPFAAPDSATVNGVCKGQTYQGNCVDRFNCGGETGISEQCIRNSETYNIENSIKLLLLYNVQKSV